MPGYTSEEMKNRLFLWTGLFTFSAGNNWIINRFCLEWAEIITQRDDALRINSPVQKDAFSGMNRRRFLKSSMAVAAVCGTSGVASLFSQAAFAEDAGIADGQTRRFDYAVLQAMAHDLARQPWGGAPRDLPPTLANLTRRPITASSMMPTTRCGTILKSVSWTSSFSTSGWGSVAACGCSL